MKLLVDIEFGTVLRADDRLRMTRRAIEAHPWMAIAQSGEVVAGPEYERAAERVDRGELVIDLAVVHYQVIGEVDGVLELQKVEDQ